MFDLGPTGLNTALLTITMFALGLVSFVLRALLNNISLQMQEMLGEFRKAVGNREATMLEVRQMMEDVKKGTDERLERLTRAVELSAQTDLLRLLGSPDVRGDVKDQARRIVEKITEEH